MLSAVKRLAVETYARSLERDISNPPAHIAIIQDGNRRFASSHGAALETGHRKGADTAERVLRWCRDLGIEELTLYAFSTENFQRPSSEREHIFDLLTEKLYEIADDEEIHRDQVRIKAIGEVDRLPSRVQEAIAYAESQTAGYDQFCLNVAVAYGGRSELLSAAQEIAAEVEAGELDPAAIDAESIHGSLYGADVREVDLIIRTGGDERTSNFLPWHANGNEAAVYFCTPYWPEFSKVDLLRAIRTYEYRERTWQRSRSQRAAALVRAFGELDLPVARGLAESVRSDHVEPLPRPEDVPRELQDAAPDGGNSDVVD